MNNGAGLQRDRTSLIVKIVLLLAFILGISIIFAGVSGLRIYESSGFSSETAFQAIHRLGKATEADWRMSVRPLFASLPSEEQAELEDMVYHTLHSAWEKQKAGSGKELDSILEEAGTSRTEILFRLLYITDQVGGPKVSSAQKKAMAAVPEKDKSDNSVK